MGGEQKDQPIIAQKKEETIRIDTDRLPPGANLDSSKGEKCNNCGGFGYTVGLKGTKIDCQLCGKTGVKQPTLAELAARMTTLEVDNRKLKKALIATLEAVGAPMPLEVRAAV